VKLESPHESSRWTQVCLMYNDMIFNIFEGKNILDG
jgi:hypothetical protein